MLDKSYNFQEIDFNILTETTQEYPWFALGQQLLAKATYQFKKDNYIHQLQKAALLAYSRENLFDYLMAKSKENIEERIATPETSISQPIKQEEIVKKADPTDIEKPIFVSEAIIETRIETKLEENAVEIKNPLGTNLEPAISPIVNGEGEEVKSRDDLREMVRKELARIEKERNESKANQQKGDITTEASDQKSTQDILENFIKKAPSINKPAEEADEVTMRLAKESLKEHFDFVSETLAEIYFKQGNHSKAKKIYEQLILKLPEKKLYFAARIKEIVDNK